MTARLYTITELAREFDVTPRTVRFYEDQGLLAPAREGAGGMRRVFSARDRARLKLTLRGKRLGFTLSEIRNLLDLYDSPRDTEPQLQAFLQAIAEQRRVLESQLADLNATLNDLAATEAQCRALLRPARPAPAPAPKPGRPRAAPPASGPRAGRRAAKTATTQEETLND